MINYFRNQLHHKNKQIDLSTILIFDILNIIIKYSDNNEFKEQFYYEHANKITEIYLTNGKHIDLSKFPKLKILKLPNNTTITDNDLKYLYPNLHNKIALYKS